MAAYNTSRACILLTFILINCIRCDADTRNGDSNKMSQSSEKDSKISDHEQEVENEVIVDNTGINVNQKVPIDNVNDKHVSSSHANNQPVNSHSDQGEGKASSSSHPGSNNNNKVPPNKMSSFSNLATDTDRSDNMVMVNDEDAKDNILLFEESGDPDESLIEQMNRLSDKIKEKQKKEKVEMEMQKLNELKYERKTELNMRNNDNDALKTNEDIPDNEIKESVKNSLKNELKENAKLSNLESTQKVNTYDQNTRESGNVLENFKETDHIDIIPDAVNVDSNMEFNADVEYFIQEKDKTTDNDVTLLKDSGTFPDNKDLKSGVEQESVESNENNFKTHETKEESVVEQMKNIEKKMNNGKQVQPSAIQANDYSDDENDFPTDEELDAFEINYEVKDVKTNYEQDEPGLEMTLDNTEPPLSEILASKTQDKNNVLDKQQTLEDQMYVGATPSLENIKSTVHSTPHADITEQIEATAKLDMTATKRFLSGKERKKLRLEKNKSPDNSKYDKVHEPSYTKTAVNTFHTVTLGLNEQKEMEKKLPSDGDNSRFSATKGHVLTEAELETSEEKLSGTMYDTNALKEAVTQEKPIEMNTERTEELVPTAVKGKSGGRHI